MANLLATLPDLLAHWDLDAARIPEGATTERRLSDLAGVFADPKAYEAALTEGDPLCYRVSSIEPAQGSGDLHYGLGTLFPGKVGDEYFLTKGHLHETREAAEVYIGVAGVGGMLLEDEESGESRWISFGEGKVVYVPGFTAHRTINTGTVPLTYFGVYPANAGHDYGAIAERNFREVVVEVAGKATALSRADYLQSVA